MSRRNKRLGETFCNLIGRSTAVLSCVLAGYAVPTPIVAQNPAAASAAESSPIVATLPEPTPINGLPADVPIERTPVQVGARTFQLEPGLEMTLAAGRPLVERPICIAADAQGRLYVAESSGSNDPVAKQLEEKPHQILRLVDRDGDGVFDERTVFVTHCMFPEGVAWHDGSLYVGAPPHIWKFTDDDDDGVADRHEVWFDGKTLTGCANDVHGPILGPDGWLYWCKGAWAQQTHALTDGSTLDTQASHVFRRRPSGGPLEPVMSGGMDNPVEVAFTRGGERVITTTFLQHPEDGRRDGLLHIVYGGLYGKDHAPIRNCTRTGPLMPVLEHLGAAAPAGLVVLETDGLGQDFRDALLACSFNLRQVSAHMLAPRGATFESRSRPIVSSADLDFHPTDVLEDVDGTVLVVDTGGWYKLCCPSSQLWKPEELGAIYRIARTASHEAATPADPRGSAIQWDLLKPDDCAALLGDARPAVWRAAQRKLLENGPQSVGSLASALVSSAEFPNPERLVWTLCQIDGEGARAAVRAALSHPSPIARLAAIHATSLWRDRGALPRLLQIVADDAPFQRRAAAEALGRLKAPAAIETLLEQLDRATTQDRVLQHGLTYALWEIGDARQLRPLWQRPELTPPQRNGLLWAMEQCPTGSLLDWEQAAPYLDSDDPTLAAGMWWVVDRHDEWIEPLLAKLTISWRAEDEPTGAWRPTIEWLASRIDDPRVNAWVQRQLQSASGEPGSRRWIAALLQRLSAAGGSPALLSEDWDPVWLRLLDDKVLSAPNDQSAPFFSTLLDALAASQRDQTRLSPSLRQRMRTLAAVPRIATDHRLRTMRLSLDAQGKLGEEEFAWVLEHVVPETPPSRRALAVEICQQTPMSDPQFRGFVARLASAVPVELSRMVDLALQQARGSGARQLLLLKNLGRNDAATSLDPLPLEESLASDDAEVQSAWHALRDAISAAQSDRRQQLEDRLARLPLGRINEGQKIFHSSQTACFSCHAIGYQGGRVGPDLTHIGRIRSQRDLLESILFPSVSFVRSYEPVTVVTHEGRALSGLLESETADELVLRVSATQTHRLARNEVQEIRMGGPSVMPAGMGELLTDQQLADLLAFLAAA